MGGMTAKNVRMTEDVSHFITLGSAQEIDKEEVRITFTAEWQGKPVTFRMEVDRYRHSSGISEWRIYAGTAVYGEELHAFGVKELSDTAKSRLTHVARPKVQDWLYSGAFDQSHVRTLAGAIKNLAYGLRPYSDSPTREVRAAIAKHRMVIGDARAVQLEQMADAYDAFARVYNTPLD